MLAGILGVSDGAVFGLLLGCDLILGSEWLFGVGWDCFLMRSFRNVLSSDWSCVFVRFANSVSSMDTSHSRRWFLKVCSAAL